MTASASDEDDTPGSTFVRLNLSKIVTSTENYDCFMALFSFGTRH